MKSSLTISNASLCLDLEHKSVLICHRVVVCGVQLIFKKVAEHSTCHGPMEQSAERINGVRRAIVLHAIDRHRPPSMVAGENGMSERFDIFDFVAATLWRFLFSPYFTVVRFGQCSRSCGGGIQSRFRWVANSTWQLSNDIRYRFLT